MTFYLYRNFLMGKRRRWGTQKAGFVILFIALCLALAFFPSPLMLTLFVWPRASQLTSQCFGFFICKMGIINIILDERHALRIKERRWTCQSCLTLCDPMDCSLPGFSVHGISRQEYENGLLFPSPGDLPHPGIEPRSPALQANFTIWTS